MSLISYLCKTLAFTFTFAVASVSVEIAQAQQHTDQLQDVEKLFSDALTLYKRGDYKSAEQAFELVLQMADAHQRTTAAHIMKAKAQLYAGEFQDAETTVTSFFERHPTSNYRADAEYTLGLVYLKSHFPEKALITFINSWRTAASRPKSVTLHDGLVVAMDSTIDNYFSLTSLQRLVAEIPGGSEREFLLIKLAQKQAATGEYDAASMTLSGIQRGYPVSSFPERVNALEAKLSSPRELKLGLLLPLLRKSQHGAREKEIGVGLYEGITFATEEYLRNPQLPKVTLEVRDSEREPSVAVAAMKELADDASVIGVVGPAFSHEAFGVSWIANEKGIPLITPTANANGIAATGPFVFQASPDLETRAKAMAEYAVGNLRLRRLAVLASKEQSSRILAEAFAKEAVRLGGEVIAIEWYEKGTTNLALQLTALRRKGNSATQEPYLSFNERMTKKELMKLNKLGMSAKLLDTLRSVRGVVNATHFFGDSAKGRLDEEGIPYALGDPRIDSLHRITTTIQGLYCPLSSSSEIGVVSSQIAYFGIGTRILGSGEWNSLSELNANKRYCKGVVFESDISADVRNANVGEFTGQFLRRFGRQPNRNNFYGYDVANLILTAIQKGARTRDQLKASLSDVRSSNSLHSRISLFPRRVNTWLHIFEYENNTIQHVTEIEVE
jgi:ABC-type branched-subunit amino acid transport system substrate-binding protein